MDSSGAEFKWMNSSYWKQKIRLGREETKVKRRQTSHDRVSHTRGQNNATNKNVSERVTGARWRVHGKNYQEQIQNKPIFRYTGRFIPVLSPEWIQSVLQLYLLHLQFVVYKWASRLTQKLCKSFEKLVLCVKQWLAEYVHSPYLQHSAGRTVALAAVLLVRQTSLFSFSLFWGGSDHEGRTAWAGCWLLATKGRSR